MPLKLNKNRTTILTVAIEDADGTMQTFKVKCKLLKRHEAENSDKALIDEVLVSVDGLDICNDEGVALGTSDALEAIKNDFELSALIAQAYRLGNDKTLMKSRTFLEQQENS